jgi:hypothetical protein
MEWTIPTQNLDVSKVRISSVTKSYKSMAALSYIDGELVFPSLSILLPHLMVKSYDVESGKLVLSLSGLTALSNKITALQTLILQTTYANYRSWFSGEKERTYNELTTLFQPLISHGAIYLYCPLSNIAPYNDIRVFSGGGWTNNTSPSTLFKVGNKIRIAVRLQGISFHQHPVTKMWTGKSRVQHRILAIYAD